MALWEKLRRAGHDLVRTDLTAAERAVRLGQRIVDAGKLDPRVAVKRLVVVDLGEPPKPIRGMRDLVVRLGTDDDAAAISAVDNTPLELVRARLARGDLAYLGLTGGRVVCKTWFHQGPTSFDEDHDLIASWQLDASTFWSFDGAAAGEAMATGVFIKMFVDALRELFGQRGAARVLGTIRNTNQPSLGLHDRLGFQRAGTVTTVAVPGLKWVHWGGGGGGRQWLVRRSKPFSIAPPPR